MEIRKVYPPHHRRNHFPWFRVWVDAQSIGYWWNPEIHPTRTWPVDYPAISPFFKRMEDDAWLEEGLELPQ